jgi:hypothetical protein
VANPVSSLLVRIGADTSGLESGGRRASKSMEDLGSKAAELGKKLAVLGAAAAAAGAALATKLVKSGLDAIDAQAKLARSLDASIDGLRGLQLAASDAGVKNEQLTTGLRNLNARLGEAMRGTGAGKAALDALGLSARALSQLDTDQRMAVIADRMRELGLSSSQAADLLRKLGFESENFVPLMLAGGDAIRQARQDVDELGLSLSAVDAAKVEQANDAMARIGLTFEAIRNQVTIALAPILKELADRFNAVSKENQGFGQHAARAVEIAIKVFARLADAVHLVRIGVTGLQTVAMGFSAAFWSSAEASINAMRAIANAVIDGVNAASRALNQLPGVELPQLDRFTGGEFFHFIESGADTARQTLINLREELSALVSQQWPSEKAEEFLAAVRARAEEAAQAVASVTTGGAGASLGGSEGKEDPRAAEIEKYRETLAAKLEALQEFQMTEADLELKRHEERLLTLSEALALEMVTAEEARALQESLEEDHMRRMGEIRKKGWSDIQKFQNSTLSQQVRQVSGYLADITAGVARENKAMFEINKAAGIANAIVSAYEGISKTLGAYPYPINIALAAAHAAAAFAQVSAIKSQSFSSGGGAAPSLAGGTPATPVTPVNGGTPQSAGGGSLLTVEGVSPDALFSGRTVRALAERLAEHQRDGGTVVFA